MNKCGSGCDCSCNCCCCSCVNDSMEDTEYEDLDSLEDFVEQEDE